MADRLWHIPPSRIEKQCLRENPPLYLLSRKDAKRLEEHERWLTSYQENCVCARSIELAIKDAYADNQLDELCAKQIIDKFGFDRVNWVLAHTIQYNGFDVRFSEEQRLWAKGYNIPYDDHYLQRNFAVGLHPSLVTLFIELILKIWKDLKLYDKSHCYDESEYKLDYTGKVVVVSPYVLKDALKSPLYQLMFVFDEMANSQSDEPKVIDGIFLANKSREKLKRSDILGVLKLELLPEWAQTKSIRFLNRRKQLADRRTQM